MTRRTFLAVLVLLATRFAAAPPALAADRFVLFEKTPDAAVFTEGRSAVRVEVDGDDHRGVRAAVHNLLDDIDRATGVRPNAASSAPMTVVVGSLDRSRFIKDLVKSGAIDAKALRGKTEKFVIKVEADRIVIAGSDQRGTIYGVYELAEQLGVSPWAWWADVPVARHDAVYLSKGEYTDGEPAVRYRGIFINDEAPCLTSWVKNTYGTSYGDHRFYARVFELILRLRGNLLWPAMWSWAFYADDPANGATADSLGVVIGTSHHEPMARNHQEWARRRKEWGAWNYRTNQGAIDRFFREGIERMKGTEDIVTIGMRGDGDEAMSKETDTRLLEQVVANQRKIIRQVTGKPASQTPQVWALYKEVLDYYDAGMRVPDDVTMLLCDDNWGNIRRLPDAAERRRAGGWGMYYHVDYVGAPRNSKWLCNTPVQNMWEQMTLAYDYGVDRLWILNVGDIKPMEYSISEFLSLAWNPRAYDADNLLDHTRRWCAQQFGGDVADEAARILNLQLKYSGRVTAEMLDAKTYDLASGEWERVVNEYRQLELDALRLRDRVAHRDAYFQLILFPVQAMANLYELYYAQAMNHRLYAASDPEANVWADRAERAFGRDAELCRQYNEELAGGKWRGMMTQKHIGYTSWNDNFPRDTMPAVYRVGVVTDDGASAANRGKCVFTARDGMVAMEAEHYFHAAAPASPKAHWTVVPHMGRTLSGVAVMPYTEPTDGAELTYRMRVPAAAREATVRVMVKSNLAFQRADGHRYAVAFDGGEAQTVNFNGHLNEKPENIYDVYYPTVARRVVTSTLRFALTGKGTGDGLVERTLSLRPLDPGVVFEKIYIDLDGTHPATYLGYPESAFSR